jgi:hypothetical protein
MARGHGFSQARALFIPDLHSPGKTGPVRSDGAGREEVRSGWSAGLPTDITPEGSDRFRHDAGLNSARWRRRFAWPGKRLDDLLVFEREGGVEFAPEPCRPRAPLLGEVYHGVVSGRRAAALVEIAPQLQGHYHHDKNQYEDA